MRSSTLADNVDKGLAIVFGQIRGKIVNVVSKVDFMTNQALVTVLFEPLKAVDTAVKAVEHAAETVKDIKKEKVKGGQK